MKPELLIQIKDGRIMHVASTHDVTITWIDHDKPDGAAWPAFRQNEMLPHDLLVLKVKDVRATLTPVPF